MKNLELSRDHKKSRIVLNSYGRNIEKFRGVKLDLVWFDDEPHIYKDKSVDEIGEKIKKVISTNG